ncbi:mitochondrial fission ELM1 family protein [Chenggangzhangella methanolivorans]|uniref:Mitochondrial fission ELM1 family protein n=1 Tax=Chenggangzhangella methanolivorans TaxID=1437009 RepID=A0A9E6RCP0_9HYPH|nr:mitochondrial fission ELM1 family protein [Chenggangzhangella methanolivorans]QZO01410.1 mitochondrial fission ELM1 family protein [Chenggangzhangella methanolivorans]
MSEPEGAAGPTVWLLTDDRPGNRSQAIGAARALGRPFEEKRLAFNEKAKRATPRLGATLETLDDVSQASIAPPWPDLVMGAGRRVAPIARYVKERSGGRAKVVLVGRRAPGGFADLTIRCSYFRQAPDPTLLELSLPPTKIDAAALAAAATGPDPLDGLPHPRAVALVGGPTGRHLFSDAFAGRMAQELAAAATAAGASLAMVTSRRTPPSAIAEMRRNAPTADIREWRPGGGPDPVAALLAFADLLVVTGESESMLAEAAAAGKPLTIVPLREKPAGWKQRLRDRIAAAAQGSGPVARVCARAMRDGWVSPRRSLADLHAVIVSRGWGRVFDGRLNLDPPAPREEDSLVRERTEALFATPVSEKAA